MSKVRKIYSLVALVNMFVLIGAPTLAFSSGDLFHKQGGLASMLEGRAVFLALESVNVGALTDLDSAVLDSFLGMHVVELVPGDQSHIHGMFDGCCAIGGLVCDAGLTPGLINVPFMLQHALQNAGKILNLAGVSIRPLYHPPKP